MRVSVSAIGFAIALFVGLPAGQAIARQVPAVSEGKPSALPRVPLTIRSAKGKHAFRVEVARAPNEQELGLMFRQRLAPDAGMIFPMAAPRIASFWMKNTMIPLDLIFVRADGTIARIAADATPYSLAPIDSGEPVAAVLELAGGRAAALCIVAGDRVIWGG